MKGPSNMKQSRVPNTKQRLAAERNWRMLQIKGAAGQLEHQLYNVVLPSIVRNGLLAQLATIRSKLLQASDDRWKQELSAEEAKNETQTTG